MSRALDERDVEGFSIGSVRIARRVLRSVIEEAAVSVSGVARVAHEAAPIPPALNHAAPCRGIGVTTRGHDVMVDLFLIAEQGFNLARIGAGAQIAVATAIESLLGMRVIAVNVYVQDVA